MISLVLTAGITQHPVSQFWLNPPCVGWEAHWPAWLFHAEVFAIVENLASVSVCIYREADVNHICPVFLAKREREIFVTRVIGFPAICIKISRCDCWCLTWDQLKKEGISRTNCVHVDTWLVCVCACVCASLLQCVCFKVKQNFSSKNLCPLLLGPSFCLVYVIFSSSDCPCLTNQDQFRFFGRFFSSHSSSQLFCCTSQWLTLITVLFHAGRASFLEKFPQCYKLLEGQCEIPSNTTVTNQSRVQHRVWTARQQVSPVLCSVSFPCFSHLFSCQSAGSILDYAWRLNSCISLSRLCPQKLSPDPPILSPFSSLC